MFKQLNFKSSSSGCPTIASGWKFTEQFKHQNNLIICSDIKRAEELQEQINFFEPQLAVSIFPAWDTLPFEIVSPSREISGSRLAIVGQILNRELSTIITPINALIQKTFNADQVKSLVFSLSKESPLTYNEIILKLATAGYNRTSLVQAVGDYSVRGAVIDFFCANLSQPVRLEFNDQKIVRLRFFEADSQRSREALEKIIVFPVREQLNFKLLNKPALFATACANIDLRSHELEIPPSYLQAIKAILENGEHIPGQEMLTAVALNNFNSILDFLPDDIQVILDQTNLLEKFFEETYSYYQERYTRQLGERFILPKFEQLIASPLELTAQLSKFALHSFNSFNDGSDKTDNFNDITANYEIDLNKLQIKIPQQQKDELLVSFINQWRKKDYKICFVVNNPERANLLKNKLLSLDFEAEFLDQSFEQYRATANTPPLGVILGNLSQGFKIHSQKIVIISEREALSSHSRRKGIHRSSNYKKLLGTLNNLSISDFVVHEDYGIAIYQGLQQLTIEGIPGEFVQLDYADSKLFLPVHSLGRIQKYTGPEDTTPPLDKLSSKRWQTTKQRIKQAVLALAGDLIKLYATRSISKGQHYSKFNTNDQAFAEDFPYDETVDQINAIEETLQDLSQDKPMDRLICGDVGFGKTEVAMRAAFKVAQHGKQVALLAPTTVLVEQHRESFEKRFANFPIRIAALSRFYSKESNRTTLELLAQGKLDIIIGTQALLQHAVNFFELGLVIIDEEHRFGVKQKEFLKKLRVQVDILTLTATPIPRTLHMSLIGIRDISVISTAPQERQFVKTYIANFDEHIVKDAITRELQRGGQVFFVHNRVQTIETIAAQIRDLAPEARIAVAHGQMKPASLERIMHSFVKHQIDVLVSTTIIESGLDIPNANTIIINRADALGLSQLYQLRGRVGRSSRKAYAYLLVPKINQLSTTAYERLKALEELDDLGRGFNLAIRDLEIRGSGNLLGQEQSGNVSAVGYDLYVKILQEAIYNLSGKTNDLEQLIEPEIKLSIAAFIPEWYIPDISERLVLYQRLSSINNQEQGISLEEEILDRYGAAPEETANLILLMTFRGVVKQFGVLKIEQNQNNVKVTFAPNAPIDPDKLIKLIKNDPKMYQLQGHRLNINFEGHELKIDASFYSDFKNLLQNLTTKS